MPGKSTQESPANNGAEPRAISRRRLLTASIGGAGLVGAAAMSVSLDASRRAFAGEPQSPHGHAHHLMPTVVGEVDHARNGFNPSKMLTVDPGKVGKRPNGQTLREYTFIAQNTVIEVVPGLKFAIGAGAVFQVAYEISRRMICSAMSERHIPVTVFAGVLTGMLTLYVTGVAIK